jgi:hypothetical protein
LCVLRLPICHLLNVRMNSGTVCFIRWFPILSCVYFRDLRGTLQYTLTANGCKGALRHFYILLWPPVANTRSGSCHSLMHRQREMTRALLVLIFNIPLIRFFDSHWHPSNSHRFPVPSGSCPPPQPPLAPPTPLPLHIPSIYTPGFIPSHILVFIAYTSDTDEYVCLCVLFASYSACQWISNCQCMAFMYFNMCTL